MATKKKASKKITKSIKKKVSKTKVSPKKATSKKKVAKKAVKKKAAPKKVKVIKKKYTPSTEFEEFQKLCKIVGTGLSAFDPIIRGIIYNSYARKGLTINWEP